MPQFQPIATYQELRRCVLNFPSAAMAPTTISAPGRFLSLPKSVASVGVDAWNKKVWAVESLSRWVQKIRIWYAHHQPFFGMTMM